MGRAGRAPKQAVAATDDVDQDDDNDTKCERCGLGDDEPNLVLCDGCPRGWRLRPPAQAPARSQGVVVVPPVRARKPTKGGGGDDDARGSPAAPASGVHAQAQEDRHPRANDALDAAKRRRGCWIDAHPTMT